MASTNKTTNYELSQYIGSDKPTYLGDYNGDMLKIDTAIHNNATAITTAQTTAETASTTAGTAQTTANTANTTANTANTTANSALSKATTNETNITALQTANTYSETADIPCGIWTDGKIIYKRTTTFTQLQNVYYLNKIGDNGFGTFIKAEGLFYRKDYPIFQIVPSRSNEAYACEWKSGGFGGYATGQGSGDIQLNMIWGNSVNSNTFDSIVITWYFTKYNEPA